MNAKKLLITGASGFLGSRISRYYSDSYTVITPEHKEMDITDADSVNRLFSAFMPDVVVHCAAVSDTGMCEREPERSFQINVIGSENIARASRTVGAKCIICSSDQVYFGSVKKNAPWHFLRAERGRVSDIFLSRECASAGGIGNEISYETRKDAHQETEVLSPVNVYGKQKLEAERRCLAVDPDCVALRLSWMYDAFSENPGEHSDFLRTLLAARKENRPLSYPVYDLRGITWAGQVVQNLERAFTLPGGVYNFGSENTLSTYDTLLAVYALLGWNTDNIQKNEEAFRTNPRNLSMNTEKLQTYGISFSSTVEGIANCLKSL